MPPFAGTRPAADLVAVDHHDMTVTRASSHAAAKPGEAAADDGHVGLRGRAVAEDGGASDTVHSRASMRSPR